MLGPLLYKITYRKPANAPDQHPEFYRSEFVQIEGGDGFPDGLAMYLLGEWGRTFVPGSVRVDPVMDVTAGELERAGVSVRYWRAVR